MKDLPHHMRKIIHHVVRSMRWDEDIEPLMPETLHKSESPRQKRKKAKQALRKARAMRTPLKMTAEERNEKMKKRVPVFDRRNAKPKHAKRSHKKVPRI